MKGQEFEARFRELVRNLSAIRDNEGCFECERCERCSGSTFCKD